MLFLECAQAREQGSRLKRRFDFHHGIEEGIGARCAIDRFRLVKCGTKRRLGAFMQGKEEVLGRG